MITPPKETAILVCKDMKISLLPTLAPEQRLSLAVIGSRGGVLAQCYLEDRHARELAKVLDRWLYVCLESDCKEN